MKRWSILYRGPLSSCNYACDYCPFAKTQNTRQELADDKQKLTRFIDWVESRTDREIGILFTPWGEALIRKYYREGMKNLSHMPHVKRVAIQTNLSCSTGWMSECNLESFALWTTWHPTQASLSNFTQKCKQLDEIGVRYSVGVVGFKEALPEIQTLRQILNPKTYLWINAFKRDPNYYSEDDIRTFEEIDPLFRLNTTYHPSLNEACQAGSTAFTVDGDGQARRCHFIKEPIGNIYDPNFDSSLKPRLCTNSTCGCFIGYVHMDKLNLYQTLNEGILERVLDYTWDGERGSNV